MPRSVDSSSPLPLPPASPRGYTPGRCFYSSRSVCAGSFVPQRSSRPSILLRVPPSRDSSFFPRLLPPSSLLPVSSSSRRARALGYLTLIRPSNVRTTRHVMHPPIVNFPNVVTSLRGVIRIPAGLVIVVDTRLSAGRIVPARSSLCFSAPAMRAATCSGVSACFACYRPHRGHRESIFYTFYPRRYLSRSARKRSLLYNSLFPISGRGQGRRGQVH